MPKKAKTPVRQHRTPYTPVVYTQTDRGEGRAKQSFKDECDINNIVAKYETTGVLTHLNASQATYQDVSEVGSYQDALNRVKEIEAHFYALPSELRDQFDNDPSKYIDAIGAASESDLDALGKESYGNNTGAAGLEEKAPENSAEGESG